MAEESKKLTTTDRLRRLGATCRFFVESPTYAEDERTGKMKQVSAGKTNCEIIDLTLNEPYAKASGTNETEALEASLAIAEDPKTQRPMTPAQRAFSLQGDARASEMQAEIDRLKAQLASIESREPAKPKSERVMALK